MGVKFTDVCHIRIGGNDIYKDSIDSLKRNYILRTFSRKIYKHTSQIMGIVGMLGVMTSYSIFQKRSEELIELYDKTQKIFENWKRAK